MQTVLYQNTDLLCSEIGLGTAGFGTSVAKEDAFAQLDHWLENGGTVIDTAHVYGSSDPENESPSERTIGDWMAARGTRDHVILCTKGCHPSFDASTGTMGAPRVNAKALEADLAMSLESLKTDAIDLYFLHRDDPDTPVEEIIDALEAQVQKGTIRYYGCSNWTLDRIRAAADYAKEKGFRGFVCNQMVAPLAKKNDMIMAHMGMVGMDKAMLAYHEQTGLGLMTAQTLCNGYYHKRLAGAELPGFLGFQYQCETNDRLFERIEQLAKDGIPVSSVLHAYNRSYSFPSVSLMGFSRLEQMDEVLHAIEIRPDAEALAQLRGILWGSED